MAWLNSELAFWKDFFELHPKLKGLGCSAIQNLFLNCKIYFCTYLHLPCLTKKVSYNFSSFKSLLSLHAAQLNVLKYGPCLTEREQRAGWEKSLVKNILHCWPYTVQVCWVTTSARKIPLLKLLTQKSYFCCKTQWFSLLLLVYLS